MRRPASNLQVVVGWLAVLWGIFIVDVILRVTCDFWLANEVGLRPRTVQGLWGIVCAHLLHADGRHLAANSLSLAVLGLLCLAISRRLTGVALVYAGLGAGVFAWVFGSWGASSPQIHLGASGLIFGLIGFLLANGLFRRGCVNLLVALLIGLLYLSALPAMLPSVNASSPVPISWEMHLGGFVGGVLASWHTRRQRPT